MQPFTIKVLGGQFTVHEVISQDQSNPAEAIGRMLSVPAERWFVVLDERWDGQPRDALALIDDQFEFQTVATGVFEGEE